MAMKQTQTKMFDFADVGLDFCSGSKNLFPDRFKKMLSQGYNEQTVASVSVTGNQVILNYGVAHGYAADRVLKINSGPLAAINAGEFWIDAVTATSVTMTIDAAPVSIVGGFVTKIAPLGYELVYELNNIQIYKFKALDESDLYLRLCYQNNASYRNRVSPCIGKTVDLSTGVITDPFALVANANILTPGVFAWEFSRSADSTSNNYTYSQGYSSFGKGNVVGSKYHLCLFSWSSGLADYFIRTNAIIPYSGFDYDVLNYPVLIGEIYGSPSSIGSDSGQLSIQVGGAYVGNHRVIFQESTKMASYTLADHSNSNASFLPTSIDNFNTTTANLPPVFLHASGQFIGHFIGGLYFCRYGTTNTPSFSATTLPSIQVDAELNTKLVLHGMNAANNNERLYIAAPLEEIKVGY